MSGSMMDGFIDLSVVGIVEGKPEPEGTTALGLLQAAYRDVTQPLSVRMRAAIEAAPFESPKLSATAVLTSEDFATRLERAILRSDVRVCLDCPLAVEAISFLAFPLRFKGTALTSLSSAIVSKCQKQPAALTAQTAVPSTRLFVPRQTRRQIARSSAAGAVPRSKDAMASSSSNTFWWVVQGPKPKHRVVHKRLLNCCPNSGTFVLLCQTTLF